VRTGRGVTIRCVIVDDEPRGRERVATLLRAIPDAEIVAQCGNGSEAIEVIDALRPDLLFLDIQMPELDGFGVLAAIPRDRLPEVIFVTAHDRYAIKAFEVHAQDYLLKPFDSERLLAAYARAAERVRSDRVRDPDAPVLALLRTMEQRRTLRTRVPIRIDGSVQLLPVADIAWIESSDNHVKIHANGHTYVVRQTLQSMEASLSPQDFIRVHRTAIVNVSRIKEIQPWFNGEYVVVLHDGTQIRTSHGYRARLEVLMR
jgi:two-component system, LytTR family, response regulator